jgi:DNA polymerase-3 subunit delta'
VKGNNINIINLDNFIGQAGTVEKLKAQLRLGRVSHAYMFCGSPGMGKRTLAGMLAGVLLCEAAVAPTGGAATATTAGVAGNAATMSGEADSAVYEPAAQNSGAVAYMSVHGAADNAAPMRDAAWKACGTCNSCKLLKSGAGPDLRVVRAETGKTIPVDEIRAVNSWVSVRPTYSERKVYIIEEADLMSVSAQNALLKTLEEPPSYAAAIMTAANPRALLETVRSRCVMYNFSRYSDSEVAAIIRNHSDKLYKSNESSKTDELSKSNEISKSNESYKTDEVYKSNELSKSDFYIKFADGIPGSAIELMSSGDFNDLREYAINLLQRHIEGDAAAFVRLCDFIEKGKDNFYRISKILIYFLRDIWLYQIHGNESILINFDKKGIIHSLSGRCDIRGILSCIEEIENTGVSIAANSNYLLAVNVMLLKINALREELKANA